MAPHYLTSPPPSSSSYPEICASLILDLSLSFSSLFLSLHSPTPLPTTTTTTTTIMASPTPPPYHHYPSTKPHHQPSHNHPLRRTPRKIPSLPPTPSSSTTSTSTATTATATSSSPSRSSSSELGPDFRGARSTRVVSKRNLNRPRYSSSTISGRAPSPSALVCLAQLSHVGPGEKSTADLLHSFDQLLSGTDDYGFLIREIGEQRISSGGLHLKALQCFHFAITRMRGPTERGKLLTSLITALGKLGRPDLARQAFDSAISDGYASTVYAYSALIAAYARNGLSSLALSAFDSMKSAGMRPNSVTYNTLIDACVKGGEDLHTTIGIFRQMLRKGVRPDRITFNSLLAGCSRAGHWEHARNMFDEMLRHGIHRDVFTYNTLIDAVCKCGNMDMAADIVSEMEAHRINPNIITYSTLMDGYSKLERYDDALSLYERLKSFSIPMDRVCFNTLLSIYVRMGRYDDVVRTSEEMEKLGVDRDVVTYNALIAGYGKQGRFEVVSYLIQSMRAEDIVMNVLTYSTLIDVYSKGGMYQKAMEIYMEFRETGLRADVVFYTTLIDTLSKNGRVESAVWLLNEMIRVGIRPNVVTYNSIINAFGRNGGGDEEGRRDRGQLVKGQRNSQEFFCILGLFQRMHSLGIRPNVVTFSSILNACSHCDSFEDASLLLEQLRSFDGRVYGVAHGLLMGSKEVWAQARLLFDELKRMDASTAAAFYNALTDMLWHFGQRQAAQLVVMEGKRRNAWDTTWTDSCLDLHLMSPGAAQAMVHAWLLNMRSVAYEGRELPQLVSILTGWGKHSKVSGSSALRRSIEHLLASLGTPFHVERFNMGRFISHGVDLSAWLCDGCDVNTLILYDARVQTETGGFGQLPDLKALKL